MSPARWYLCVGPCLGVCRGEVQPHRDQGFHHHHKGSDQNEAEGGKALQKRSKYEIKHCRYLAECVNIGIKHDFPFIIIC